MKSIEEVAKWAGLNKYSHIVDLGAWRGNLSWNFVQLANKGRVVSVEPSIENMRFLLKRIAKGNNSHITPVLAAIGNKNTFDYLWIADRDRTRGNSLFENRTRTDNTDKRWIPIMTWDTLVDLVQIDKVDYCKVNIEGAEEQLLEGMTKVFPKCMTIEEHTSEGLTDVDNLEYLLKLRGYRIDKKIKGKVITTYYVKR